MQSGVIKIRILNWNTYQHSNGKRTYNWFKFPNDFFSSFEVSKLTPGELKVWLYILCEAARCRSDEVCIDLAYTSHATRIDRPYILRLLTKVEEFQWVTRELGTTDKIRLDKIRLDKKYIGTRVAKLPSAHVDESNVLELQKPSLDLEKLYLLYPKRKNSKKSLGLARLARSIKNDHVKFTQCEKAIENYAQYVRESDKEGDLIKQFSTFANEWQDWIEVEKKERRKLYAFEVEAIENGAELRNE